MHKYKQGLVSVVMATHNPKLEYIKKAVDSIVSQSYPQVELVLVDDGSDNCNISQLFKSFQINIPYRIVSLPGQSGLAKALNAGVQEAQGEFIARLDDDDYSSPDRIEKEVHTLQNNANVCCTFTAVTVIDAKGEQLYNIVHTLDAPKKIRNQLICKGNPFCHSSVMFKHEMYDEVGGYNPQYTFAQDYELWLRFSERWDLSYTPEICTFWRFADGTKSIQKESLQTAYCEAARYAAYLKNRTIAATVRYVFSRMYATAQILFIKSKQNFRK